MKNIKKTVATLGLLGIIIMSASSARAGIFMSDRSAPVVEDNTNIARIYDALVKTVIGEITGVKIQSLTGIIITD